MKPMQAYEALKNAIDNAREIPPCQVSDPDAWFPNYLEGDTGDFRAAKRLCKMCPVQKECLTYALVANEVHGVWGGLAPKERSRLRAKIS